MRILCPAKINLHLRVGPRRNDGFHGLLSWMTTVGLFDTLTMEPGDDRDKELANRSTGDTGIAGLSLRCDMPGLHCDERNLIMRIAAAWRAETFPAADRPTGENSSTRVAPPLSMTLEKRIPMGAGLGGGSSNAARTLLGLNQLWGNGASLARLSDFAARFGSDLTFFLHGPSSICTGRGEIVRPTLRPAPAWALLILPGTSMPTPQVYRRFDEMGLGRSGDLESEPDWGRWAHLSATELLPLLVNDLEPAAFSIDPSLGILRERIEQSLGRPVRMSGSGSSLFTLFDTKRQAELAMIDTANELRSLQEARAIAVEMAPN